MICMRSKSWRVNWKRGINSWVLKKSHMIYVCASKACQVETRHVGRCRVWKSYTRTVPMCVHVRLCVYNDVYVPFTRLCWFTLEDYKRFHICFISMSFISFHLLIRLPLRSPSLFLVLVAHFCCCSLFGILCVHNIDYFSFGCCFQLWTVHSELLKFYFFKYFYFEIYRESILFRSLIDVSRFISNSSIFMHYCVI